MAANADADAAAVSPVDDGVCAVTTAAKATGSKKPDLLGCILMNVSR